ncbi:MAG: hypothetical protein PWP23_2579 [Candidatus Sumerlaeota bacterium]|nr:hypothetical protein [Candidatus Sumerlaeota bacterium]
MTSAPFPPNDEQYPRPSPDDPWVRALAALFDYDELHVRQRVFTLSEKYEFTDAYGQPRFFVVRPPRLALTMALAAVIGILRIGILILVVSMLMKGGSFGIGIGILIVTNFLLNLTFVLAAPYRHIQVYADESEAWRLMTITQDNKLGLTRDYTIYDCFGEEVARLRRHTIWSIFRASWLAETPSGQPITRVREDSLLRALLRRYLGPLYGILRTNFNFEYPDGTIYGKFDRKLTLTDQYLLDLRGDPDRLVDRRVTLAASILLDTGERR